MQEKKLKTSENYSFKPITYSDDSASVTPVFYTKLCVEELSYENFKKKVFARNKFLKEVEKKICTKLDNTIGLPDCLKSQKEDVLTHFCMRLVCGQSRFAIKWFVTNETQLFKIKLAEMTPELDRSGEESPELNRFFEKNVWPYLKIDKHLDSSTYYHPENVNTRVFNSSIKFHFTSCPDILATRRIPVKQGFFDKNDKVLTSFMIECFRKYLESSMNLLYNKIVVESDERLIKLNNEIFMMPDVTNEKLGGDVNELLDFLPLCIKGIIGKLKTNGHLKYVDRQVLCRFFKDIGISLNECVSFFRKNFKCSQEQFVKDYLYNIRHNYGLEGKKANYSSFSCTAIIGTSNDAGCFGCPFVNNHDFVKANSDIEDLGKDAIKSCSSMASKIIGKEIEKYHISPAEFFRAVYKEENAKAAK